MYNRIKKKWVNGVDVLAVIEGIGTYNYRWGREENIMWIDYNSRYECGFMALKINMYVLHAWICGHINICTFYMCIYLYSCV